MKRRELVFKTLNFDNPYRIPRQLWPPPQLNQFKKNSSFRNLRSRFPDDLVFCPHFGRRPFEPKEEKMGKLYWDKWGYRPKGQAEERHEVIIPPLVRNGEDWEKWPAQAGSLTLDKNKVNAFCRATDRFILAGTWIRPFETLQMLRGPETLLADLKIQPTEFFLLLRRVHEFYLKKMEIWAETEVNGLCLMDDWGSQDRLLISPALFRQLFKPLYEEYASLARHYKKYLFFHSDGFILDLLPEFIELGINAINCQVFLLGPEKLARFRGRLTFWGNSDLQTRLSQATHSEIFKDCKLMYETLWDHGGFIAQAELAPGIKIPALKSYFSAWNRLSRKKPPSARC